MMYGGMPTAAIEPDEREKRKYLQGLFSNVYIKDIVERYKLRGDSLLDILVDILSSSVGSLTNPNKLANTAGSRMGPCESDSGSGPYAHTEGGISGGQNERKSGDGDGGGFTGNGAEQAS